MRQRFWLVGLLFALLSIPSAAMAQGTGPGDLVRAFLNGRGYTVQAVGYLTDDNGNAQTDRVAVAMDAAGTSFDNSALWEQAWWGFTALRQYYPQSSVLFVLGGYRQYIFVFPVTSEVYDQYKNNQISADAFWGAVRNVADVYDSDKKQFVGTKDFTNTNQTDKNFGAGTSNVCNLKSGESGVWIQNLYKNQTMRFTIGGGEWGTHDYDVPGDGKKWVITFPPGRYTYTASIAGAGVAHGERFDYQTGVCYAIVFSP